MSRALANETGLPPKVEPKRKRKRTTRERRDRSRRAIYRLARERQEAWAERDVETAGERTVDLRDAFDDRRKDRAGR